MIPRSPSPTLMVPHRERKPSVSSKSSRSSEVRHRRKTEGSPSDYRQVIISPDYTDDYDSLDRKKRKKKERKHKKEKKNKKKKKRSKHHSRSTSLDSLDSDSVETPPKSKNEEKEVLSDWESPTVKPLPPITDKIDTSACSPVSNVRNARARYVMCELGVERQPHCVARAIGAGKALPQSGGGGYAAPEKPQGLPAAKGVAAHATPGADQGEQFGGGLRKTQGVRLFTDSD